MGKQSAAEHSVTFTLWGLAALALLPAWPSSHGTELCLSRHCERIEPGGRLMSKPIAISPAEAADPLAIWELVEAN
jgi:hypothetical protein